MKKIKVAGFAFIAALLMVGCGNGSTPATEDNTEDATAVKESNVDENIDPMEDKGVGPVTAVDLGALNQEMVDAGKELYETKCTACHKLEKRHVGPALNGIMARRTPEWVMNMILDPDKMVKENKQARDLLMEYSAPMANQSLTEDEARNILEYFRTLQ